MKLPTPPKGLQPVSAPKLNTPAFTGGKMPGVSEASTDPEEENLRITNKLMQRLQMRDQSRKLK